MAYNSKLSTPQIEQALGAALLNEKNQYNITQDKGSNYSTLAEAIASVSDDKYKVKGIVLTFYTGTDWVSKRYNGEDASGFANEGNWIDVGGAAGGTQYLDLSMFSEESGTLSEEDYQKVVKAYEDKISTFYTEGSVLSGLVMYKSGAYIIITSAGMVSVGSDGILNFSTTSIEESKEYSVLKFNLNLSKSGSGTKALTDNGQYAEFAKPTKVESGGSGTVTKQIKPNTFYKFGYCSSLTVTLGAEESGIVNEYMFEFTTGSTPPTLRLPDSVKWSGGSAPTIEANKTYQVSIVNNLAVYASF